VKPSGQSVLGSIGRRSSDGASTSAYSGLPSVSRRYHSGTGTPKKRCRLMSQSPLRPPTQLS